jgi:hypothetical protein
MSTLPATAVLVATGLYLLSGTAAQSKEACPIDRESIRQLEYAGTISPLSDEDAPAFFQAKGYPSCLAPMPAPVQCEGGKYTSAQYLLPNETDSPTEDPSGTLVVPVCIDPGIDEKWRTKLEAQGFQLLDMVPERLSFEVLLSPTFGQAAGGNQATKRAVETKNSEELKATFVFELNSLGVQAVLMAGEAQFMGMRIVLKVRGLPDQYTSGISFSLPDCAAYPNRYFDVRNGQSGCRNARRRLLYVKQSRSEAN